jgi:macrolide-specific efflux system membrane fusion protein
MWMKIPSKIPKKNINPILLLLIISLLSLWHPWLTKASAQQLPVPSPSTRGDILLSGKLACSLKRAVIVPFLGIITALPVQPGQKVTQGELLAGYRLSPESILTIRSRIFPSEIKNLELTQTNLADRLDELKRQQAGLQQLAADKMTSRQSLDMVEDQINAVCRQRNATAERLDFARQLNQDDTRLLQKQLGIRGPIKNIPSEGRLTAPLNGYVIWMHPDIRLGAEFKPGEPAFIVGNLDTMIIKAQVHELDAMRLRLGEQAEVQVSSLPDKKFTAQVTRISWSSITSTPDQPSFFEVEFSVANPDHVLKDGLKVQLTVPKAAVS